MKTASAIALMFAMGVAAPISSMLFQEARFVASIWNFVAFGFCVGAVAGWLAPARSGWSLLAVFLGVALGLFTYGLIESFVFSRDHNLLPIGILLWELTLLIPAALGVLICRIIIATRNPRSNDNAI